MLLPAAWIARLPTLGRPSGPAITSRTSVHPLPVPPSAVPPVTSTCVPSLNVAASEFDGDGDGDGDGGADDAAVGGADDGRGDGDADPQAGTPIISTLNLLIMSPIIPLHRLEEGCPPGRR